MVWPSQGWMGQKYHNPVAFVPIIVPSAGAATRAIRATWANFFAERRGRPSPGALVGHLQSVARREIAAYVARRLRRHRVRRGSTLRQCEGDAERLAAGPAFAGPVPAAPELA